MKTNKSIILAALAAALAAPLQAQTAGGRTTATGVVVDAQGLPVVGASIRVKNSNMATVTDVNGAFAIVAPAGGEIEVGYIGYKKSRVKVGENIEVVLEEDSQVLGDVVVIGYGTAKRSDVSGAVASVDTKTMMKKAPQNVNALLQGAVAGVYVTGSTGAPNSNPSVRIRGIATINGSADPLYVVDGVQMGTNISYLNPADIASIEVLKDASATAIYGAQGANGVIMVTTKKGQKGSIHVDASADFGIQTLSTTLATLDADGYAGAIRTARQNDGAVLAMPVWGEDYDGQRRTTDWQRVMTRTALRQNYNASVSGGTDRMQGVFSVRYLDYEGMVHNSDYDKYNARAAFKGDLNRFVTMGGEVNLTHSKTCNINGNLRQFALLTPTMDYTDSEGRLIQPNLVNENGTYGTFFQNSGKTEIGAGRDNIYASQMESNSKYVATAVNANFNVALTLCRGLKVHAIYGFSASDTDQNTYNIRRERYNNVYDDNGVMGLKKMWLVSQSTANKLNMTKSNSYTHSLEDYITYHWSNDVHDLNLMVGNSVSRYDGSWNGAVAGDFPYDTIRNISLTNDPESKEASGAYNIGSRSISYYGRVMYAFRSRYNVTASMRHDGSSHFGRRNRWGNFPSFAASWRISEEGFMQQVDWISNLKLRAGWGRTGNSGNATDLIVPQLSSENVVYKFYTEGAASSEPIVSNGIAQSIIVDNKLKWETNMQTNIGLDLGVLGGSLNVSVDYFIRTTTDLLLYKIIRPSIGFQRIYSNFGKIRNRGLEFSIDYKKQLTADWHIGAQLTGSTIDNEVVECGKDILSNYGFNQGMHWQNTSLCRNGYAIGAWYGYRTDGIFRSQAEVDAANALAQEKGNKFYQQAAQVGDIKFRDVNGDGTITDDDLDVIGHGFPKMNFGLNLTAQWRWLDFSVNSYGVLGQKILSYSAMNMSLMTSSDSYVPNILRSELNKAWSAENPEGPNPRLSITDANWNMRASDFWIRNGNYFKIANVQVGYTLHEQVARRLDLTSARVYFAIDNPVCFSPYNKYGDPELSGSILHQGVDTGKYPTPRTYVLGISLQF